MRILICDDDTLIIEQLKKYIESYFESNHLKCPELVSFTSGEALLTDKGEKDIVFLDIEMPAINGMEVADAIRRLLPDILVIFVTSHTEYALDAYELSIFRYISKADLEDKLRHAFLDAVKLIQICLLYTSPSPRDTR